MAVCPAAGIPLRVCRIRRVPADRVFCHCIHDLGTTRVLRKAAHRYGICIRLFVRRYGNAVFIRLGYFRLPGVQMQRVLICGDVRSDTILVVPVVPRLCDRQFCLFGRMAVCPAAVIPLRVRRIRRVPINRILCQFIVDFGSVIIFR